MRAWLMALFLIPLVLAAPPLYPGDVEPDGEVDIKDLMLIVKNFGLTSYDERADTNNDDQINILDLVYVGKHWGVIYYQSSNGCPDVYPESLVLCYDFEDWTGDAETTPNYFSSTSAEEYWQNHITGTEIVTSGDTDCEGRDAYSGNYYFHQNFFTGALDPCLGTTPLSTASRTDVGLYSRYPANPKSDFYMPTDIKSDTVTVRFYFRTTGNWPNPNTNNIQLIRLYGTSSSHQLLTINDDGSNLDISDNPHPDNPSPSYGDYHNTFTSPVDWTDGEWHSFTIKVNRLNDVGNAPNLDVSVWFDDWDMNGPSHGNTTTYHPGFGRYFGRITLFASIGGNPNSDMGIDMDQLEIWDGNVVEATACTDGETRACSTGQQGICSAGTQTCSGGTWGACVADNSPTTETCGNGIDEDCDGDDLVCGSGCPDTHPEGMVLCYGFEDWTGYAETTPGYIFRIVDSGAWERQTTASEAVTFCDGRGPHSGEYFWRLRKDKTYDECLGTTPIYENPYIRFGNGEGAIYPLGSGDTTDLRYAITGEVMTTRFWFRLTGHWPVEGVQPGYTSKFVRACFGPDDYESDNRCGHLQFRSDALGFAIYDAGNIDSDRFPTDDLDDGKWHSISIVMERLNNVSINPNYNMEFWIDDWNMEGSSTGARDLYVTYPGYHPFRMIALWVNYGGAASPIEEHAIEYDDFEIWDGLPR